MSTEETVANTASEGVQDETVPPVDTTDGDAPITEEATTEQPKEEDTGPRTVVYCGVCSVPPEYCEYGSSKVKCKAWLQANDPKVFYALYGGDAPVDCEVADAAEDIEKMTVADDEIVEEAPKAKPSGPKKKMPIITIQRLQRNKRKFVTAVGGIQAYGIKHKEATKVFANKFSCGASLAKGCDDIIDIQGDVGHELVPLLVEKWGVPERSISFMKDTTKKKNRH